MEKMKILIEESILRQALETFTHCYAETDRRINERAKLLVELRTSLDAAEKVEPVAWIITTDNTNLHQLDPNRENNWLAFDVNQFKNDSARALVISNTQPLYLHPALDAAEKVEVDVNAATMLRLLDTLKYMTGIAERGRGYKCPDNVMPERFLLEYVIELESNNPPSAEIEELEHQLAECERERDMLRKFHHDQQELHERNEANAQTNRLRLLQIVELRAACQMALDEFESRKRDTEEEGYMYIESVAHAKLREVLK